MENNRALHSLVFAFVAAIIWMIITYLIYSMEMFDNMLIGWVPYIGLIGMMVYGQINWKNKKEGGIISYGQSFLYGLFYSIWLALIVGVWTYLLYSVIAPDFMSKMLEVSRQKMEADNMPEEQVEMAIAMSEKFMTPGIMVTGAIIFVSIFGVIVALITSAFIRKERSPFDMQQDQMNQQYYNQNQN